MLNPKFILRNFLHRYLPVVYLSLFCAFSLSAQLTVVQGSAMNMTPQQLVQNYLVGPGITVNNVTFNGSSLLITSNQVGTFETTGIATTQLGLTGGIIMTSGKADIAIGPNNSPGAGVNTGGSGDPDLNIIANASTFDKAVIEFDFIPEYDTVKFSYVFGSEEFFEYCNQFNDAFGFFLSGPGITGTFSNNSINIALMPGSGTLYVTIDNICANVFSRWDNSGGTYYQYDALTHVFTATAVVQPCSTYHIKLAIADAVDHAFDSGVFLEENSFSSIGVDMTTSSHNPSIGNKAVEGCNDIDFHFNLTDTLDYPYIVDFEISGTAVNGTDYTWIPDTLLFPPGTVERTLTIHPLTDLIPEGPESVIITIDQISCDGSVTSDTIDLYDYIPLSVGPIPDTVLCHGEDLILRAQAYDGYPPYQYHWNISASHDSILPYVPPVGNNQVILTVTDLCPNAVSDSSLILVHPTPVSYAGPDMVIPNGTGVTLSGSASGGYGVYSWAWNSNPPGFSSSQQNPFTGNIYLTTIFSLTATDVSSQCESDPDEVIVIVEGGPLSVNPVASPPGICLGDSTQLFALAGGGSGLYTYSWYSDPAGFSSTLASPVVSPVMNTLYYVTANDGFNAVAGQTSVSVYPLPEIYLGPPDTTVCIYDTITLDAGNPGSTYEWSDYSTGRYLTASSPGIGFDIQTFSVIVTNENGCVDSAQIQLIFSFAACVGINEPTASDPFRVFPNPGKGIFYISQYAPSDTPDITVYSLYGTPVFRDPARSANGNAGISLLDLSMLPKGMYLLHLRSASYSCAKKLIIQ
jgi:hypothetical protein